MIADSGNLIALSKPGNKIISDKSAVWLVTVLFFLWGLAHSMLDVLNKYFQEALTITRAESGLVQTAVYIAYFIFAIPSGLMLMKLGYRKTMLCGLVLFFLGCLIFVGAVFLFSYYIFLTALFIVACGLASLETAANPYISNTGETAGSAQRLNTAQAFCGLGFFAGPMFIGTIVFKHTSGSQSLGYVAIPYLAIALVLAILIFIFYNTIIPEKSDTKDFHHVQESFTGFGFMKDKVLILGVIAQFIYVAGQTGINAMYINFVTETFKGISNHKAALVLSFAGMGMFVTGRFVGAWLMRWIKPVKLMFVFSFLIALLLIPVIFSVPLLSMLALNACFFFMSIILPTNFSLLVDYSGKGGKQISPILIMAVSGGALSPFLMGFIADHYSTSLSFILPFFGFIYIGLYGIFLAKNLKDPLINNIS